MFVLLYEQLLFYKQSNFVQNSLFLALFFFNL